MLSCFLLGGRLQAGEISILTAADQAPKVEIYTASYCPECKRAKTFLRSQKIDFIEYDIEHDIDKRREFYARGGKGIPLFFINGKVMHGFDQTQFESLFLKRT